MGWLWLGIWVGINLVFQAKGMVDDGHLFYLDRE